MRLVQCVSVISLKTGSNINSAMIGSPKPPPASAGALWEESRELHSARLRTSVVPGDDDEIKMAADDLNTMRRQWVFVDETRRLMDVSPVIQSAWHVAMTMMTQVTMRTHFGNETRRSVTTFQATGPDGRRLRLIVLIGSNGVTQAVSQSWNLSGNKCLYSIQACFILTSYLFHALIKVQRFISFLWFRVYALVKDSLVFLYIICKLIPLQIRSS